MNQLTTITPNPPVELNQAVPNFQNQIPSPTRKPYVLFIFVFLIFCITLFIFWASYSIYQIKKQQKVPSPSPTIKTVNTVNTTDNVTKKREGVYACAPLNGGVCALYPADNIERICSITFKTENCDNQCGDKVNWCK